MPQDSEYKGNQRQEEVISETLKDQVVRAPSPEVPLYADPVLSVAHSFLVFSVFLVGP